MKNLLQTFSLDINFLSLVQDKSSRPVVFHRLCLDTSSKVYILISENDELLLAVCELTKSQRSNLRLNDLDFLVVMNFHSEDLLEGTVEITSLAYVAGLQSICFTTRKGEIVKYDISSEEAELVGLISAGITNMEWSPDDEIVVFTT